MNKRRLVFCLLLIFLEIAEAKVEFLYSYTGQNFPFLGMINGTDVNIREEPNLKSRSIKKAAIGETYYITNSTQGFYQLRMPPLRGWISVDYIALDPEDDTLPMIKFGTLTGNDVNLRKEPSLKSPVISKLKKGTEFIIYNEEAGFYDVELKETRRAYIHRELISPKRSSCFIVSGDRVNLRSGPGTSYAKTGILFEGQIVTVIKFTDDFGRVLLENGKSGWVSAQYLKKSESSPEVSSRETILNHFKEENLIQVISLGEKFLSSSPVLDQEVTRAVVIAHYSLSDYARALFYISQIKKQAPEYYLGELAGLEEKINMHLGRYQLLDISGARNLSSCDLQLDGIEDYLFLRIDPESSFVSFHNWENRLVSGMKSLTLSKEIDDFYFRSLDLDNDSKPELVVRSGMELLAYSSLDGRSFTSIKLPSVEDICFEERHSLKLYGLQKKGSAWHVFREGIPFGTGSRTSQPLSLDLTRPSLFPAYLNTEEPHFFLVSKPNGIWKITWDKSLKVTPLNLPPYLQKKGILSASPVDYNFDDVSDLLVIFSGSEIEPSVLKIFRVKDDTLVEVYSLEISALAARGVDLDWNGKLDMIVISPKSQVYILFDINCN
ncbi:MAG: SH3 domain-containing protein [Candidatus Wallbacteria bacterium]|nr:SH3 domain-containing protein [Candidatus Wallbacteria bacterium]